MSQHIFRRAGLSSLVMLHCSFMPLAAQDSPTVADHLRGFVYMTSQKCPEVKEQIRKLKAQGKEDEARAIEDGSKSMCECWPARAKALMVELPQAELRRVVSDVRFIEQFQGRLFHKCAAQQLSATYEGDCPQRFKSKISNSSEYCKCMLASVQKLSDAEAFELGLNSADWVPQAAKAKKDGTAPPERPPLLKRHMSDDASCRGK